MSNRRTWQGTAIAAILLTGVFAADAQTLNRKIDLPKDSPVTLVSDAWGDSGATIRGGAYVLDLHVALTLRNSSQRRIRGITLTVLTQEIDARRQGIHFGSEHRYRAGRNLPGEGRPAFAASGGIAIRRATGGSGS